MEVRDARGQVLCEAPFSQDMEEVVAYYRHYYFYDHPGSPQVVQVNDALYDLWGDKIQQGGVAR